MSEWIVIYQYSASHEETVLVQPVQATKRVIFRSPLSIRQLLGFALLALGLGGIFGPYTPNIRLEAAQVLRSYQLSAFSNQQKPLPKSAPVIFEPLTTPDGASIDPINDEFSLIVPKVGINAAISADIDPSKAVNYADALSRGIAHAATSFLPDEDGTVYLFSHSTNYDWFVKDLNAVFYLLKNLEKGDVELPAKYGPAMTCWRRLKAWQKKGVWKTIWKELLRMLEKEEKIQWEVTYLDGTFAPAKKGEPKSGSPRKAKAQS